MNVEVGDRVQIRNGGIDVTNGNKARSGRYYGQGGPLWCNVTSIVKNWGTGGRFGLPSTVTKVVCVNGGTTVWQVRPQDIADNIIKASKPETVQKSHSKEEKKGSLTPKKDKVEKGKFNDTSNSKKEKPIVRAEITKVESDRVIQTSEVSLAPYAIKKGSNHWQKDNQIKTSSNTTGKLPETIEGMTKIISGSAMDDGKGPNVFYRRKNINMDSLGPMPKNVNPLSHMEYDEETGKYKRVKETLYEAHTDTAWETYSKKRQILSEDYENIQNPLGFPAYANDLYPENWNTGYAAKYDYQIMPNDPKYHRISSLEDKLQEIRSSMGIQVHGNNNIARAVKYYMYNRFKVPDTNLAHNKTVTYVFFTRPDLNLLRYSDGNSGECEAIQQVINHSETSFVYRRYPELFKLLTDYERCKDNNNFNFLLSNQVTSFDISDETLSTNDIGKTWREHSMVYGDSFTGRTAGEFSCNFTETSDYSIINLMRLWITYIDNVASGAWSPSYNLRSTEINPKPGIAITSSHVYTKTLDYASSAYVFKCGPDGEDILYWTKYYGVFPVNTGESALSWNNDDPIGTSPNLNIKFRYCFKRPLSPISLIEFNHNANIKENADATYENSFNPEFNHSSRPFVGCPFVEINLGKPSMRANGVNFAPENNTQLRLKFRKTSDDLLTDQLLYRSYNSLAPSSLSIL